MSWLVSFKETPQVQNYVIFFQLGGAYYFKFSLYSNIGELRVSL